MPATRENYCSVSPIIGDLCERGGVLIQRKMSGTIVPEWCHVLHRCMSVVHYPFRDHYQLFIKYVQRLHNDRELIDAMMTLYRVLELDHSQGYAEPICDFVAARMS